VGDSYIAYYTIPALSNCMIYIFIYYRVKTRNRAKILVRAIHKNKRDLEFLPNILILLGIYLTGAIPILLFLLTSNRIFYLIGIVTISLAVAIEKLCTDFFDRELREVIRNLALKMTHIIPLDNAHTPAKYQGNLIHIQRAVVQPSLHKKSIPL
jgi:hypothetical protein